MLKTYDFRQVSVIVGGRIMAGFAEGDDSVMVERNEDAWSLKVGADGEATRSKSNNKSGKVTLKLQQTSESNAILSAFAKADELSNSGAVPVLIKDNSGLSLHAAEQAWVIKMPSSGFGAESGEREWVLESDNMEMFEGGN